ncbi:MAG: site-specific DNA-methyltransferase [Deltaproteobacteria bacterium]|nr:site-specific DNA-methyltransferase [Deltaproteobacteria bacterium]
MVLDFFAGSGVTTRVAIDEKRHSIAVDSSPTLYQYLEQQLADINHVAHFNEDYSYEILNDIALHPVYLKKTPKDLLAYL